MNFQAHIGNEESWGYGHQVGRAIDKEFYTKIDNKDFRKHSWLDPDRNFYAYKSCRPNGSASNSVPHRELTATTRSAVLRTSRACASKRCISSKPKLRPRAIWSQLVSCSIRS